MRPGGEKRGQARRGRSLGLGYAPAAVADKGGQMRTFEYISSTRPCPGGGNRFGSKHLRRVRATDGAHFLRRRPLAVQRGQVPAEMTGLEAVDAMEQGFDK